LILCLREIDPVYSVYVSCPFANQSKIKSGEQLHLFAGFLQLSSKYELVQNKVDLQEYK
jgi:hypothetical protein